jgi:hypothetical protein
MNITNGNSDLSNNDISSTDAFVVIRLIDNSDNRRPTVFIYYFTTISKNNMSEVQTSEV